VEVKASAALFLLGLGLVDAAIVGAVELGDRGNTWSGVQPPAPLASSPGPDLADVPRDEGFSFCQTRYGDADVTPTKVAISYLDSNIDRSVTVDEIRSWFGSGPDAIPPYAVDVYALEHKNGRRRIAFEVAIAKWPGWQKNAVDSEGRELCARVRAALLAANIGRPERAGDTDRSRYDFDFVFSRRTKLWRNYTFLGTLDLFLDPERLTYYRSWLDSGELE
jgi:hypothetical protein